TVPGQPQYPLPQLPVYPPTVAQPSGPVTPVVAVAGVNATALASVPVSPIGTTPPASGSTPPLQVTNKKQFALDYEVTEGSRSKLKSVELWVTQDGGQRWSYLCDDPDLQSPILVDLPKEGVYGLRLVLRSAAGLSYGPPQPGDLPEFLVEIDRTPPEA